MCVGSISPTRDLDGGYLAEVIHLVPWFRLGPVRVISKAGAGGVILILRRAIAPKGTGLEA